MWNFNPRIALLFLCTVLRWGQKSSHSVMFK